MTSTQLRWTHPTTTTYVADSPRGQYVIEQGPKVKRVGQCWTVTAPDGTESGLIISLIQAKQWAEAQG